MQDLTQFETDLWEAAGNLRATGAMTVIEADFEPLAGVLPKDYGIFEPKVLEDIMRLFNSEQVKHATVDVFSRVSTSNSRLNSPSRKPMTTANFSPLPLSLETIVNVIEPDHGIHTELAELNKEASRMADKIQEKFEELGV